MKTIYLLTFVFLLFSTNASTAMVDIEQISSEIEAAFKNSDANALKTKLGNTVEMDVLDDSGLFSKAQAIEILRNFFSKNKASDFKITHSGNSNLGARYIVATYKSGANNFRVNIYLKKSGEDYLIHEISIE